MLVVTVGPDLANNVFQVHGADVAGKAVLRKKLRHAQLLEFFGQMPPCLGYGSVWRCPFLGS